jgi:hypothetical protein
MLALAGAARADHAGEMKAREDFAAGRYSQALDLFAALYAETLNPVYLRNIGRCHQKLREPDKAIGSFRDYLAKGRTISPEEREEINGYIREMEALRIEQADEAKEAAAKPAPPVVAPAPVHPAAASPSPSPAANSGARPDLALNPSAARPTDRTPANTMLVAQPGPRTDEESSPFYARWWFWTLVGAAVAGGVVAAVALTGGTTKPSCTSPDNRPIFMCQ